MAGSSPRMRGAPVLPRRAGRRAGIIPAYAGSTVNSENQAGGFWDHPRVCGEHSLISCSSLLSSGSSPRMRGALCRGRSLSKRTGIIPAYTGSTNRVIISMSSVRDHPRICGEHKLGYPNTNRNTGSSPHMRGARLQAYRSGSVRGIIPAYAGSTRQAPCRCPPRRDHPRVCGEHASWAAC